MLTDGWLTAAGCRPGVSGSIQHIQINFFFLGSYLSGTSYVQLEWGFQHFSLPLSFFKNVKILPCFSVKHYKLIFSIFYMSNLNVWMNCTCSPDLPTVTVPPICRSAACWTFGVWCSSSACHGSLVRLELVSRDHKWWADNHNKKNITCSESNFQLSVYSQYAFFQKQSVTTLLPHKTTIGVRFLVSLQISEGLLISAFDAKLKNRVDDNLTLETWLVNLKGPINHMSGQLLHLMTMLMYCTSAF